jgi:hypothetical protein
MNLWDFDFCCIRIAYQCQIVETLPLVLMFIS